MNQLYMLCLLALTFIPTAFSAHRNPWFSELTKPQPLSNYNASAHLNIHISAHTHNDIGWLKTIDQYYYGDKRSIDMRGGVQYILDNVVSELYRDPKKRFIYVEMGFFKRWWNQQDTDTQNILKQLLANGQFEFINGGYCMNDEAAVYYEDSIDQMTIGHDFLLKTFNYIPEIGWHIDPFGHANAQASLFAQMGFKAFFFGRIDYQDKNRRLSTGNMETLWIPQTSQGLESAILAVVTYNTYFDVGNFDFSLYSSDKPLGFDPTLEDYDLPQRADDFIAWFRQMEPSYKSKELFQTLGEDFAFQDGHMDFKNYDQLFKYLGANAQKYNVNVSYSTPGRFIKALYPQNIQFEEKTDDFFPYADGPNAYWTGYFTSRVSIKGAVRKLGRFTQAMKKLATQTLLQGSSAYVKNNFGAINSALLTLEEAMANGQHHDGVTGTERQIVAEDYKLYFAKGESAVKQQFLYPLLQEKVSKDLVGLKNLQFSTCDLNTSAVFCGATFNNLKNNKPVLLVVNNPAQNRSSIVRVKVPNGNVQATDVNGTLIDTDVICSNNTDSNDCDLFFRANFGGYSISYFYLKPSSTSNQVAAQQITFGKEYPISSTQSISSDSSLQSFMLKYCKDSEGKDCLNTVLDLRYNYYKSYQSTNDQNSGAYIFRPTNDTNAGSITYTQPTSGSIYLGKNLVQIHLNQKVILTDIRIYGDLAQGVEVSSFVDSINVADNQGKEIVLRVGTPLITATGNTFYTDSMGLEMQKRVFDFRPTWNLTVNQPASGNYYPVQSAIYIQDQNSQLRMAVIPDRAQGGASLQAGVIEMMIHRRMIDDDARGVGEALNEKDWDGNGMRQWVTHTVLFSKPGYIETHYRQIQYNNDQPNVVVLAQYDGAAEIEQSPEKVMPLYEGLDLDYIKIMARPLTNLKFLYRFQNLDETQTRTVSTSVFQGQALKLAKVTEMSLSANQAKADMVRSKFNWNGRVLNNASFVNTDYLTSDHFALRPLEIRTFIGEYDQKANLIDM